jgi:hypothetical protein
MYRHPVRILCGLLLGPARAEEAWLPVSRTDLIQSLEQALPTFETEDFQRFEDVAQQERERLAGSGVNFDGVNARILQAFPNSKARLDRLEARILQARSEVKDDEQIWSLYQGDIPVQLTAAGRVKGCMRSGSASLL